MRAAEDGSFPAQVKGWEVKVLENELKDEDLVGWYRNPTGGSSSLRIPYHANGFDISMYPDFIFFHNAGGEIRPSIVDPHGFHLADAAPKLRGLADYAAHHSDSYDRIDAVVEIDKKLLALDLRSETVRDAISTVQDDGVRELFEKHAGAYS